MGVSLHYEPLYGVNSSERCIASILTIDGFSILLDCGWDSAFDTAAIQALTDRASSINAVLLSHPDIPHLGALPYLVGRCGMAAPVVSTLPIRRMGLMFMYDTYQSIVAQRPFDTFNLDDVDAAFEIGGQEKRYHLIKYQQRFALDALDGGAGIVVTPHPAGHMLGGTVWNITKGTESIVYAVDFNHRRERHLKPLSFSAFSRPSHLIISASRALSSMNARNSHELIERLESVVSGGGNALLPIDSAGRVIELAVQLSDVWASSDTLSKASLIVLSEFSVGTFRFVRSMIEYMSDEVVKRFDVSRENLFDFKNKPLHLFRTRAELTALEQSEKFPTPKVILASSSSMEYGFSRDLFVEWCTSAQNAVVLVDEPEPNTLYAKLFDRISDPEPFDLELTVKAKVQLSGEELSKWRESEKARKQAEKEEEERKLEEERKVNEEENNAGDADGDAKMGDGDDPNGVSNGENGMNNEAVPQSPGSSVSMSDFDERAEETLEKSMEEGGTFSWARHQDQVVLSRTVVEEPTWDAYGQVIDTKRFMIGEDPGEGAPERHTRVQEPTWTPVGVETEEIPTKYVSDSVSLKVACRLMFVDFAGLTDGESLKRLVKQMEPRRVVIVKGKKEETEELQRFVVESVFSSGLLQGGGENGDPADPLQDVVCPAVRQVVDITTNTPVQDVVLRDTLVDGLDWVGINNSAVAHMDAVLHKDEESGGYALDVGTGKGHGTLFIGTIMLNRLREALGKEGMSTEFAGGVLCIENTESGSVVLVKKMGPQNIVIDGAFSEEYLRVRDIVYRELIVPL